jgi:lipid A disaccharide synthetase
MIFPEFVQASVNSSQLTRVIKTWLENENVYNDKKAKLKMTRKLLSGEAFSVPAYMAQVIHG